MIIIIDMVINPIKTKSMTIATRQNHQLSALITTRSRFNGVKIDQVLEHRLLGITIDFVGTHILIMCAKQFQDESSVCRN